MAPYAPSFLPSTHPTLATAVVVEAAEGAAPYRDSRRRLGGPYTGVGIEQNRVRRFSGGL